MKIRNIEFAKFRIVMESMEDGYLPGYKGSMLRGAMGNAVKHLCCCSSERDCDNCIMESQCVYRYVFETKAPRGMERFKNAPRPYIIEPPPDSRTDYARRDELSFNLILIGKAIEYLPYFIMSSYNMGKRGLGRNRMRFRLSRVSNFTGSNDPDENVIYEPNNKLSENFKIFTGEDIERRVEEISKETIGLKFLTPLRMKHNGKHIRNVDFRCLVDDLQRRFSVISQIYWNTDQEWEPSLISDHASNVKETRASMEWFDWERFSSRQNEKMKFGGLVGEVGFQGELEEFMPLIALGEALHVGGKTTFGLGKYEIVDDVKHRVNH